MDRIRSLGKVNGALKSFQCLPSDFSPFIVIRVFHRPFFVIPTVLSSPYFVVVAAVSSSMWPSLASDTGNTILRRSAAAGRPSGCLAWLVGAHGVGSSKRTNVNVMEGAFYCFSSFFSLEPVSLGFLINYLPARKSIHYT